MPHKKRGRCGKTKKQGCNCSQKGKGLFSYVGKKGFQTASNLYRKGDPRARQLLLGELHVGKHNFTGPGSRIDLPHVRNFPPYNGIDNCSKIHDLAYDKIFKMPAGDKKRNLIRKADKDAVACYDRNKNDSGYTLAKSGINNKMRIENITPKFIKKMIGSDYLGQKGGKKVYKVCRF